MRKLIVMSAVLLSSALASAHGSLPSQAQAAMDVAVKQFLQKPKEISRQFKSINAELVGHELFSVVITLKDGSQFAYKCAEHEETDPVFWACDAL